PSYSATSSPIKKTFSSRASSSRRAWLSASRIVIVGMILFAARFNWVGVDVCVEFRRIREWTLIGETQRVFDLFAHLLVDLVERLLVYDLCFEQAGRKQFEWVALLILLDFRTRSIVARVRHRVAHEAIGANFEERWKIILARAFDRANCSFTHGQHIHAVNKLRSHFVSAGFLGDVMQRHCAGEGSAHAVLIVFADIDAGKFPKLGHVQRFVERALIHCCFAEVTKRHLVRALILGGESRSGCEWNLAADDRVTAEKAETLVEHVHRAAFAF